VSFSSVWRFRFGIALPTVVWQRRMVFLRKQSRYARSFENGKSIAFCRNVHSSLSKLWPSSRWFI